MQFGYTIDLTLVIEMSKIYSQNEGLKLIMNLFDSGVLNLALSILVDLDEIIQGSEIHFT